jgi:inner membrane protein
MEPVTHFLTGACIGRSGLNRKTAYATVAAVLAAEAADLDILWSFAGPVENLKHHRGITHTLWAVPVVAGVIVGAIWVFDRVRQSRSSRAPSDSSASGHDFSRADDGSENSRALAPEEKGQKSPSLTSPRQPIHWGWLYLTAFIAALSHILLDWTNNYGVRPFFPINPHWYVGSFMFIAEPALWLLFFLALFMPWVLGLADREIGARRTPFRGRGWAIFALIGIFIYGCLRWAEHAHAQTMLNNSTIASEPITRLALEPYPINPFHWHAILETPDFYQTAEIDTRSDSIASNPTRDVMYKPADTPAIEAAKRTLLGQVYLDWGIWAVVRDIGPVPVAGMDAPNLPPGRTWTTVEFSDLRFDYAFIPSSNYVHRGTLGGWVYVVDGHEDAGEIMGGRQQH